MRISFFYKGVMVAATLCVAPAALLAFPKASKAGAHTVAVNTGPSPNVTASLLKQIRSEAISVEKNADQLHMLLKAGYLTSGKDDAPFLDKVREHVNELNKLLSDLRAHQAEASPLQKRITERVVPPSLELVNITGRAIVSLNNNGADPYVSDLSGLANDIYKEASRVDQAVGDLDKYLHAHQEEQQLKQTLALTDKS